MLLTVAGAIALVAGLAAIGFGIPSSSLDFGNTLIGAGTTAAVGGLIVIGLGVVVARLQRIADTIAVANVIEHIEPAMPEPPRPLPPRPEPRAEVKPFEPRGPSTPPEFPPFMARKAAEPPEDKPEPPASLESPLSDASAEPNEPEPAKEAREPEKPEPLQPTADLPPKSFFESVWPEEKTLPPKREPRSEPPLRLVEPSAPPEKREEKPRAVAVLKSGVVDGMGYTLFVDGSIEAELPQGTVRFASIHELREHLEKDG